MDPEGFDSKRGASLLLSQILASINVNFLARSSHDVDVGRLGPLQWRHPVSYGLSPFIPRFITLKHSSLNIVYDICDQSPREHGGLNWLSNQVAYKDIDVGQKQQSPHWRYWTMTNMLNKIWLNMLTVWRPFYLCLSAVVVLALIRAAYQLGAQSAANPTHLCVLSFIYGHMGILPPEK